MRRFVEACRRTRTILPARRRSSGSAPTRWSPRNAGSKPASPSGSRPGFGTTLSICSKTPTGCWTASRRVGGGLTGCPQSAACSRSAAWNSSSKVPASARRPRCRSSTAARDARTRAGRSSSSSVEGAGAPVRSDAWGLRRPAASTHNLAVYLVEFRCRASATDQPGGTPRRAGSFGQLVSGAGPPSPRSADPNRRVADAGSAPPQEGTDNIRARNTLQGLSSSPRVPPSRPPGAGDRRRRGDRRGSVRNKWAS